MQNTMRRDGQGAPVEELMRRLQTAGANEEKSWLETQIFHAVAERLVVDLEQRFPRLGRADAEEIVSDALLVLFQDPRRFDPERAGLLTYLGMVVRRDAQNLLGKRDRLPVRIPLSLVGRGIGTVERDTRSTRPVLVARVEGVVERLPPVTRETMRLTLSGMTTTEIARELGCTPGTVRTRRSRGVQMIRSRLADVPLDPKRKVRS